LRQFDGDSSQVREVENFLQRFRLQYQPVETAVKTKKQHPYLLYFAGIVLIVIIVIISLNWLPDFIANRKIISTVHDKLRMIQSLQEKKISYDGTTKQITIHGSVDSYLQKITADSLVLSVPGVAGVNNQLIFREASSFSQSILEQIERKITSYRSLPDFNSQFIVEQNRVIIEGEAPSVNLKREIAYLVSEIDGVEIVINNLNVSKHTESVLQNFKTFLKTSTIYFGANSELLMESEKIKLQPIVDSLRTHKNFKLIIRGYSDNSANPEYNLQLSQQRSEVIAAYLSDNGISTQNIVIEYYGEENPIASNATAEGRAKNRRVEFDVLLR